MPAHLKSSSDDDEQSLMEYVYEQLHDQFIENIPIAAILELPPFFLYLFGAIAELLMLLTFISFFKSVYTQGMTQKFISITNDTGICEPVERSITGDFWGDTNGNWAGSADFSASLALYELILTDAKFSPTTYQTVMLMSYAALLRLGEAGKKQDLAANIAVLISWQMICRDVEDQFTASQNAVCNEFADSQQLFVFTAYSDNVFDIDSSIAALSDIQDTCNSSSFTSFDIGSRQTVATFVYSDYTANPNCARIAGPSNFGYNYDVDDNEFRISFDVRTFGDSVGINLGYLSSYDLEVVGHSPSVTFEFQGVSYLAQSFIDTAYVGMDPLYCITNQTEILDMSKGLMELCFMQLSTVFGIPLFNHYGNAGGNPTGMQSPQQCLCKPAPYGYGFEEYCDQFDLLTGVLFYQNQTMGLTQIEQMQAGIAAVLKNGNYSTLNSISYNATFAAAAIASNPSSVIDPQMHTDVWRSEAYSFCDVDVFGSCSLYVVRSFGDSLTDSSTTPFLYQLVNGSCGDPFGVPAPVFQQLVDNPPTPITESYYQCTLTEYDAVNNAVGIASGITTTIVPIAVMLLLPFIYLWLKAFNIPLPVPEYSEQQKKDVVDFFFTQLMRANDYKTRGMKKNGVLLQLVAELRHADKYGSKEAYDSDDSDEDYSDDEAGGGFGKGKDEELGKINHLSTSSAAWIKPPERRVSDRGFLNSETRNQLAEETNPLHIVKRRLSILAPQTDEEVFAAEIVKGKLAVSCCSNEILDVSLEEFIVTFIEDSSLYSLAVHHEKCDDEQIVVTPWENSEDYASVRTRTMKFVKSCDLPELEQAPATKTQKWKACGEVGTVISSSTKLENVPFADIFTVSDCLVVKAVGPSRVSVSASMDVMFSEPSSMETHIFETVSKEVIEWYVAYIAALRSYLQLHAPQSLNSPARNSFHSRFSMGHDDVEDSDDENDQGHDDKGDNAQHGDGSRGPAEIELSQL